VEAIVKIEATTASILALARAALEDRHRDLANGIPCGPASVGLAHAEYIAAASTREPALARWIEAVLGADAGLAETIAEASPGWVNVGGRLVRPDLARAWAASILRAADEAEAKR
jgi:hypothetical protein